MKNKTLIRPILNMFIILFLSSCTKEEYITYIQEPEKAIIIGNYCALGASTAAAPWQANVSKNIARKYTCFAIGGTRWTHTSSSKLDLSQNASNIADNKVLANQYARLLKEKNESGYYPDLITIMCGLNDAAAGGIPIIGNFEEAFLTDLKLTSMEEWFTSEKYKKLRETIYGSSRFIIENLIRSFPKSQIIIITSQQCNNGSYNYINVSATNDALIRIANRYSIPIIDVFKESGITDAGGLTNLYLDVDGLHPNEEGQKLLTNFITKRIRQIYFEKNN